MKLNKKTRTLEPSNKKEEKVLSKVQEANNKLLKESLEDEYHSIPKKLIK